MGVESQTSGSQRMTNPTFNVGDLVQHRASGERGVVVKVNRSCYAEGHRTGDMQNVIQHWGGFTDECQPHVDSYDVSYGFDRATTVACHLLEKIES